MSIDKITREDAISKSLDLVRDNIQKLKSLFPEILAEGIINFEALRQLLGQDIEHSEEFYRLTWAGKSQARGEAYKPSTGTLRPAKEESLSWENTKNIYIEGDNLEVLKLLQKNYGGKVKMIYIDPPYNTGKDFVYKDDYKDNLRNYMWITGQIDGEGNRLSTNSDFDGRYHSNWLNMMYPRLILARNLLQDDGVIFISIDDHEVHNLKLLMNNIYGEDNFIGHIVVETANGVFGNRATGLKTTLVKTKDYVIVYAKSNSAGNFKPLYMPTNERFDTHFSIMLDRNLEKKSFIEHIRANEDLKCYFRKYNLEISLSNISILMEIDKEFNQLIINDYSDKIYQDVNFSLNVPPEIENEVRKGRIVRYKDYIVFRTNNGRGGLRHLISFKKTLRITDHYKPEYRRSVAIGDLWEGFDNDMKNVLKEGGVHFDTPKPVRLIKQLAKWCNVKSDEIVLDFFSGSSTSAHSIMNLNMEDCCQRRYLMIQLPEATSKGSKAHRAGYETVAEIGKERIRRVVKQIKREDPIKAEATDLGFRVFKLDSSNIKSWDGNPDNLEQSLYDSIENIKEERSQEDVLYEILLKYGMDLALPIEERTVGNRTVFNVGSGSLFVCLGDDINSSVADEICRWKEECSPKACRVVFKDSGFTDVGKVNSFHTLKRFGIHEVRSI